MGCNQSKADISNRTLNGLPKIGGLCSGLRFSLGSASTHFTFSKLHLELEPKLLHFAFFLWDRDR